MSFFINKDLLFCFVEISLLFDSQFTNGSLILDRAKRMSEATPETKATPDDGVIMHCQAQKCGVECIMKDMYNCSKCKNMRYCNLTCATNDLVFHKEQCKQSILTLGAEEKIKPLNLNVVTPERTVAMFLKPTCKLDWELLYTVQESHSVSLRINTDFPDPVDDATLIQSINNAWTYQHYILQTPKHIHVLDEKAPLPDSHTSIEFIKASRKQPLRTRKGPRPLLARNKRCVRVIATSVPSAIRNEPGQMNLIMEVAID